MKRITAIAAIILTTILAAGSLVAQNAPRSGISPVDTVNQIKSLNVLNPDWTLYRGSGQSMVPYYGENSLLIVKSIDSSKIKPGMIVVFRDSASDLVGHTVTDIIDNKLKTRGATNNQHDPELIDSDSIVGVVAGAFHASSPILDSSIPQVIGKKY